MRDSIEKAIIELQSLLDQESLNEHAFQKYFENHPIVFQSLGYVNQYPKIELKDDENLLYPDFILENQFGLFEIWDVKLPYEKIIKSKKNRDELYSKISSEYAGQLREYADFFDDTSNITSIKKRYDIELNKRPKKYLIIGRAVHLDKVKLHNILSARSYDINIITYDDIIYSLTRTLKSSSLSEQRFFGTAFLTLVSLGHKPINTRRYIIDLGYHNRPERFSGYVENNIIFFSLIGKDGIERNLSHTLQPSDYHYFHFSIGCSNSISFLELYVDGTRVESLEVSARLSDRRGFDFDQRFMNCDVNKENYGVISPELTKVYNCQLDLKTRILEDNCFLSRLEWIRSQPTSEKFVFKEGTFTEFKTGLTGQNVNLHKSIESLWDLNDYPYNGAYLRQVRELLGFDYNSLPRNTIELTTLLKSGDMGFKIIHPDHNWKTNSKEYSFNPFQAKGIYIKAFKSSDGRVHVYCDGPLGSRFHFHDLAGNLSEPQSEIKFAWDEKGVTYSIDENVGHAEEL